MCIKNSQEFKVILQKYFSSVSLINSFYFTKVLIYCEIGVFIGHKKDLWRNEDLEAMKVKESFQ